MEIPSLIIQEGARERLALYLKTSGEKPEMVAIDGPTNLDKSDRDFNLFRLICAYDVLKMDIRNGFNFLRLADAYIFQEDYDSAIRTYNLLEASGHKFLGFYDSPSFNMGIVFADTGKFDASLEAMNRAILQYPESAAQITFYIGTVFHEMKEFRKAETCYLESISSRKTLQEGPQPSDAAKDSETERIQYLLEKARQKEPLQCKRKSQWLEFIH